MTTYRSAPPSATGGAGASSIRKRLDRRRERPAELVARRCAWGLSIFLVSLPLQWYQLASGPLGKIRYFHVTAMLMLLIARPPWATVRAAARSARPVFPMAAFVIIVGTVTSIGWHSGPAAYLQTGYYVIFGLVAAACMIIVFNDRAAMRILAVASPVTVLVFVAALTESAHRGGVNIARAVTQALGGDPNALEFGVFRAAFAAVAVDARTNLRHEIFGALVVTCYIGLVAASRAGYLRRVMFATTIATAGLVILSLSRSVILGVAMTAFIGLARVITARIKVGTFLIAVAGLAAIPFAFVKLLPLLSARFTETKSYDSRVAAIGQVSSAGERLLVGGPELNSPTQNLVLDVVLRAGLVAGLAALIIEIVFVVMAMRAIGFYFRTGRIEAFAVVGASMQLLVRSFTGGQYLMHEVQWVALGLMIAAFYVNSNDVGRRKTEVSTPPGPAATGAPPT